MEDQLEDAVDEVLRRTNLPEDPGSLIPHTVTPEDLRGGHSSAHDALFVALIEMLCEREILSAADVDSLFRRAIRRLFDRESIEQSDEFARNLLGFLRHETMSRVRQREEELFARSRASLT